MSLGKDLASIRKSQNLTLEDIQNATKIPVDTLKKIEDGRIFTDPDENKTYIRSFVRSYAKVLKIDDDDIIQALDELDAGTYTGSLIADSESSAPTTEPEIPNANEGKDISQEDEEEAKETDIESAKPTPESTPPKPPERKKPQTAESTDPINWADMGHKFSPAGRNSKVWLVALIIIVLGGLAGAGYYFSDEFFGLFNEQTETSDPPPSNEGITENVVPPTPIDSSQVAINDENDEQETVESTESPTPQTPITLGDTLSVDVYAAFGQLEPVRVTSDFNWQTNPFWMEEGDAYRFDFRDTLLVRGQYSRLLLLFNGHVIENPRQNYFAPSFNSIMITRSVLDQEQYLAAPPDTFPLEVGAPDSIIYRIRL